MLNRHNQIIALPTWLCVIALCVGFWTLILNSFFPRNKAFLTLSAALYSVSKEESVTLAQQAELSLKSLNDKNVVDSISVSSIIQGNSKQAITLLQSNNLSSRILIDRASYYDAHDRHELALIWYQLATQLQPDSSDAFYMLGMCYRRREEWSNAIAMQEKAVQLDSDSRNAWYELAWANMSIGNYDQSLKAFQRARVAHGDAIGDSVIHYYLGYLYQSLLKPSSINQALSEYETAIAINDFRTPYWSQRNLLSLTYFQRGNIFLELKQIESAIIEFQTSISINGESYAAYLGLALAKWEHGKRIEAIELTQKAINLNPKRLNAYWILAKFYQETGDLVKTKLIYEQILSIDPKEKDAHQKLLELKTQ